MHNDEFDHTEGPGLAFATIIGLVSVGTVALILAFMFGWL